MNKYDPESLTDRRVLATHLIEKLTDCGFTEEAMPGTKERVFTREVPTSPGMKVAVYTTVEGRAARACGKDAIRVVALYKTKAGTYRGVGKDKRVNRTGEIVGIVERTHQRMRDMWLVAKAPTRCHCGAPKFHSKAGHEVCADLCWKSDAEKAAWKPKPKRSWKRPEFAAPGRW
jgi:hypothetical protein